MANGDQGIMLNHYTMSPASDSSYHIYEMAELPDEEVSGKPQEPQEESHEEQQETQEETQEEPQEVDDIPDETSGSVPSNQKRNVNKWASSSCKQKKPSHPPPRRYNTVGEYEFMKPQLQAAAVKVKLKLATQPASTSDDAYSEIPDDVQSQQSDAYIFMQSERRQSEPFSSFLSKWFDVDKDDANVDQKKQTTDRPLSLASEEDVYITMQ